MNDNAGFAYFIGLIICSIAIGIRFTGFAGWMTFGFGIMVLGICIGMLSYLDGGKKND